MAELSQAERDKLPAEDFAGPDRSYPITDQASVESAAHLVGKADDPAAVKAKIIAIAKRKGLTLPASWDQDGGGRADQPTEQRSGAVPDTQQTQTVDDPQPSPYYVIPITRIDREQRIVEGVATSEAVDTFGTVFDYDASKKAFSDWAGNVREMHDRKAVGRRFEIRFDDAKRQVIVRSKISKGAQDTWEKVLDGTLSGYSIGAAGWLQTVCLRIPARGGRAGGVRGACRRQSVP